MKILHKIVNFLFKDVAFHIKNFSSLYFKFVFSLCAKVISTGINSETYIFVKNTGTSGNKV